MSCKNCIFNKGRKIVKKIRIGKSEISVKTNSYGDHKGTQYNLCANEKTKKEQVKRIQLKNKQLYELISESELVIITDKDICPNFKRK